MIGWGQYVNGAHAAKAQAVIGEFPLRILHDLATGFRDRVSVGIQRNRSTLSGECVADMNIFQPSGESLNP
jgi:hypothetical protein